MSEDDNISLFNLHDIIFMEVFLFHGVVLPRKHYYILSNLFFFFICFVLFYVGESNFKVIYKANRLYLCTEFVSEDDKIEFEPLWQIFFVEIFYSMELIYGGSY